jgi:cobalt-precorrin 5A hydrolase
VAREEAVIVAGVGCRRGASADEIEQAVRRALEAHGIARVDAVATETAKAQEPGIVEAARRLSAKLLSCPTSELDGIAVLTPSERVRAVKGVPSIAEASAIVAAGRNARLLGTRIATPRATCALAEGEGR